MAAELPPGERDHGLCKSGGLLYDHGQLRNGHPAANPGDSTFIRTDRLFWLVYILYIQV